MSFKGIMSFVAGVAIGAGCMYIGMKQYFEKKTENKINEELDKIHGTKTEEPKVEAEKKEEPKPGPNMDIYKQVLEKKSYDTITKTETEKKPEEKNSEKVDKKTTKKVKAPKKITQEEFDATEDDRKGSLTYYADDILANDDIIMDPTETIGASNLKSFKSNYDTMYVMNFANDMVYEVTYSNSNFKDIFGGVDYE